MGLKPSTRRNEELRKSLQSSIRPCHRHSKFVPSITCPSGHLTRKTIQHLLLTFIPLNFARTHPPLPFSCAMGRTIPPILVELRQPSSTEAQIAALRGLKNEVIGHEQKKEWWISLGVVKCLERTLSTHRSSSKRRQRDVHNNGVSSNSASDEEEARLLAVIIVGSLADGMVHVPLVQVFWLIKRRRP